MKASLCLVQWTWHVGEMRVTATANGVLICPTVVLTPIPLPAVQHGASVSLVFPAFAEHAEKVIQPERFPIGNTPLWPIAVSRMASLEGRCIFKHLECEIRYAPKVRLGGSIVQVSQRQLFCVQYPIIYRAWSSSASLRIVALFPRAFRSPAGWCLAFLVGSMFQRRRQKAWPSSAQGRRAL